LRKRIVKQPSTEQFLEACGALAPLQFEVQHQDQCETIRTTHSLPFVLVGRDEHADLPLEDARVSLRHTYLQVVDGRLWWADLDSRRGTHGKEGPKSTGFLDSGQRLGIGPFHIRLLGGCLVDDVEPSFLPNPFSSDTYDRLSLPRVRLDFVEGTAKPSLWTVDRSLTLVGRASCCKVRLHSPLVSRTHSALLHTATGLWAIDLLGRERLNVNGKAVRWALLEDADELRIGQFLIRVYSPSTPESRTPCSSPPSLMEKNVSSSAPSIIQSRPLTETAPVELSRLLSSMVSCAPLSSTVVPTGNGGTNESLLLPFIAQFSLMQQQMFDQFQQTLTMMVHMFGGLHRDQLEFLRQEMNHLHELTRELESLTTELARRIPTPSLEAGPDPSPRPIADSVPIAAPAVETTLPTQSQPSPPLMNPPADVHAWLSQRLVALQQERQSRWQRIFNTITGKRDEKAVP
jgi:hypothetical protein